MTTEIKPTTKVGAWEQFVATLEAAFPGETSTQIRQQIMDTARKGGSVGLQVRNFAGAIRDLDDLGRITRAARRWQEFAD